MNLIMLRKIARLNIISLILLIVALGCSSSSDPENSAPKVNSITANPTILIAGGTSTINVSASDPDGDQLSYSYTASGGSVTANGSSAAWTAPQQTGSYYIRVTVSDGSLSAIDSVEITVNEPITAINGTITLGSGQSATLTDIRVALYVGLEEWNQDSTYITAQANINGNSATYGIANVSTGGYYIDAWQDNDGDNVLSLGDLYGYYADGQFPDGTILLFDIIEGQPRTIDIEMFVVGPEAVQWLKKYRNYFK